jgi:hypothetical protein
MFRLRGSSPGGEEEARIVKCRKMAILLNGVLSLMQVCAWIHGRQASSTLSGCIPVVLKGTIPGPDSWANDTANARQCHVHYTVSLALTACFDSSGRKSHLGDHESGPGIVPFNTTGIHLPSVGSVVGGDVGPDRRSVKSDPGRAGDYHDIPSSAAFFRSTSIYISHAHRFNSHFNQSRLVDLGARNLVGLVLKHVKDNIVRVVRT